MVTNTGKHMQLNQGKKKLLVIEDDLGLQKQLRWNFDAYEVFVATNRESALAQVRRHEPLVVTMDLGLPPDPDGSTEGLATLQQTPRTCPAATGCRSMSRPTPKR